MSYDLPPVPHNDPSHSVFSTCSKVISTIDMWKRPGFPAFHRNMSISTSTWALAFSNHWIPHRSMQTFCDAVHFFCARREATQGKLRKQARPTLRSPSHSAASKPRNNNLRTLIDASGTWKSPFLSHWLVGVVGTALVGM